MKDCACGKPVGLRAIQVTLNRKRGVMHYIEHADGTPLHTRDSEVEWSCMMFKPYPKAGADRPYVQMIARWDAQSAEAPR